MNYYCKKNFMDLNDVVFAHIYFDNGDYISLRSSEIVDYNIELYDKMILFKDVPTPVVKRGYIKLNISKNKCQWYESKSISNKKDYNRDRKTYIENLCLDFSIITIGIKRYVGLLLVKWKTRI